MSSRALFARTVAVASSLVLAGACGDAETVEEADVPAPAAPAAADVPMDGALTDPSTADVSTLAALPGMTQSLAEALVSGRPYETMLDVDGVLDDTLDEAAREELYRHLFMPLDLNSATSEEIQLIPGVGDRMTHEFEEYRPYDDIARFRREMAKYVDDAEVARLERYVTIR